MTCTPGEQDAGAPASPSAGISFGLDPRRVAPSRPRKGFAGFLFVSPLGGMGVGRRGVEPMFQSTEGPVTPVLGACLLSLVSSFSTSCY
jgi:hypothetical protein